MLSCISVQEYWRKNQMVSTLDYMVIWLLMLQIQYFIKKDILQIIPAILIISCSMQLFRGNSICLLQIEKFHLLWEALQNRPILCSSLILVTSPMFVIAVKNPVYLVNLDKIYKKLRNISKAKKDFGPNLEPRLGRCWVLRISMPCCS